MAEKVFKARVLQGGLLVHHRPADYARHVRSLAGKFVEVICRVERRQRSNQQNRWVWGHAYEEILAAWGYAPDERTPSTKEDLHEKLVGLCFGTHWDDRLKCQVRNVRTSKLSTAEFSQYMEWLPRYVAQEPTLGFALMLPNEVDYSSIPDEAVAC
jgi:hypothetical protein